MAESDDKPERKTINIGVSVGMTLADLWLERKTTFVRARVRLLEMASRGSDSRYQRIVDNWLSVRAADASRWDPQEASELVFGYYGADQLEREVHAALAACHEKILELRVFFRAAPESDLSDLTEKEVAYLTRP